MAIGESDQAGQRVAATVDIWQGYGNAKLRYMLRVWSYA
ncbi:hypothetical protein MRBBS_3267 [Marinobacter sp. BSs20148]|nr:hypothetical protein MRBBS_3267 [Marinobacter sp. BSs20148]